MTCDATPKLDARVSRSLLRELLARMPGYLPGWMPAEGSPPMALFQVFARYLESLIERLNQAPEKNELGFLDLLGVNLLPAQAARAPVLFQAMTGVGDGRVPARTRVGAKRPGESQPLIFETERDIALAQARLAEIVTVWPGRDSYADHSAASARGETFTLFEPLKPMAHELYLSHSITFSLVGKATVELYLDLARGGRKLAVAWEYWDGERWQGFKEFSAKDQAGQSFDGTDGLSRSGVIRLMTECGDAVKTKVNGIENFWVRGRLTEPLPPQPGSELPAVDRILARSVIERPLHKSIFGCGGDIQPDQAFANGSKLDVSKPFSPFGKNADHNSAFYFASEEIFSKPGAQVKICFSRAVTPEEEADKLEAELLEESARKLILDTTDKAAQAVIDAGKSARSLAESVLIDPNQPPQGPVNALSDKITELENKKNAMQANPDFASLSSAITDVVQAIDDMQPQIAASIIVLSISQNGAKKLKELMDAAGKFTVKITSRAQDALDSLAKLGALVAASARDPVLNAARWAARTVSDAARSLIILDLTSLIFIQGLTEVTQLEAATADLTEITALSDLADLADAAVKAIDHDFESFLFDLIPFASNSDKPAQLVGLLHTASTNAQAILTPLETLWGLEGAGTVGKEDKALAPPRLVWEYWNGTGWKRLLGPVNDKATNFTGGGVVSFTVPADFKPATVNDVTARWMRVRLDDGTYGRLRIVSWHDAVSNKVNLMSVVEPRPPSIEGFYLGYVYKSPKTAPEDCLSFNDFQFRDHMKSADFSGPPFDPYKPTDDRTPALYLGFDRPLPADLISLYFNIEEVAEQTKGPALKWEYHDGEQWLPLSVEDGTSSLALPGMIAAVWPGVEPALLASVLKAGGTDAQLSDARQAARFKPGNLIYISEEGNGEMAIVTGVSRDKLTFKTPLEQTYGRATVSLASLPRFGVPRAWMRARLEFEDEPPRSEFRGIHPNSVWATQTQTIENELLGSSGAQAGEVLFFRHTPVLEGEAVEVRELEGPRAAVELPILRDEILREGMTDADIRTVTDRRSGQVSEAWVRWRVRPNLFFSGPGDRDLVIERTQGRIIFGDGARGRIPPAGADNIRALNYRSGGGLAGNVSAGSISQLLSGVVASSITNPRAAEGGADTESVESVLRRGPQVIRHRHQALTRADFETLAREASPAVASARALPGTHPNGRPAPGWVTLVIVPQSNDAQPQPSFELRRRVRDFLLARSPASMGGLAVIGPVYLPIGVEAVVAALNPSEAGPVGERVGLALARFLHPLTGGPEGAGWDFGRGVYLSDVAAVLEAIEGVDYVETINLLVGETPQGEKVEVPVNRIVVAGPLQIKLRASEG